MINHLSGLLLSHPWGALHPGIDTDRRKYRKGRKPSAVFRRVGFLNDIKRIGERFDWPVGAAPAGGNWRKLADTPCSNFARRSKLDCTPLVRQQNNGQWVDH